MCQLTAVAMCMRVCVCTGMSVYFPMRNYSLCLCSRSLFCMCRHLCGKSMLTVKRRWLYWIASLPIQTVLMCVYALQLSFFFHNFSISFPIVHSSYQHLPQTRTHTMDRSPQEKDADSDTDSHYSLPPYNGPPPALGPRSEVDEVIVSDALGPSSPESVQSASSNATFYPPSSTSSNEALIPSSNPSSSSPTSYQSSSSSPGTSSNSQSDRPQNSPDNRQGGLEFLNYLTNALQQYVTNPDTQELFRKFRDELHKQYANKHRYNNKESNRLREIFKKMSLKKP